MALCVEPFSEGQSAWKKGLIGFFLRCRGMALIILLSVLTMGGVPWWWPVAFKGDDKLEIPLKHGIIFLILTLAVLLVIVFYYLRWRSIRSLSIKTFLHEIAHYLRDHQTLIYSLVKNKDFGDKEKAYVHSLTTCMDRICEYVQVYFSKLTYDSTVAAAIRIATEADLKRKKKIVYHTVGRSIGLSQARAETTEDIPANKGIPKYLIEESLISESRCKTSSDFFPCMAS